MSYKYSRFYHKKHAKVSKGWATFLVILAFVALVGVIGYLCHLLGYLQPAEDWIVNGYERIRQWITGSQAEQSRIVWRALIASIR